MTSSGSESGRVKPNPTRLLVSKNLPYPQLRSRPFLPQTAIAHPYLLSATIAPRIKIPSQPDRAIS
jgi:hypothetical protein